MMQCTKRGLRFSCWYPVRLPAGMLPHSPAHASAPCEPPNVIPQSVCDMDQFYGDRPRQLPVGWSAFVLSGDPVYYQDDHTYFGGPNLTMWSVGGTFKAGIYTQVQVTPGAGYRASISWGAPNAPDLFGRQLGIDPTGGTDPTAPTVIWGPMHWGEGRILNYPPPDVNIDVRARAVNGTVTVFFLTDHPQSSGDNLILVDAIALYPDDSAPAVELPPTATPESPTATPEPPTPEPVAVAAAPVEAPAAVALPTDTPTILPTDTPTALPTDTPTATPSPTPTAHPHAAAHRHLDTHPHCHPGGRYGASPEPGLDRSPIRQPAGICGDWGSRPRERQCAGRVVGVGAT